MTCTGAARLASRMRAITAGWPRTVEQAADAHEPHRVAFYAQETAAAFHQLWNKGRDDSQLRFIQADAPEATQARLALVQGVAAIIGSALDLIGVDNVLFGSDYPHPEGLADPIAWVDELDAFSDDEKAKVMGHNLARIMNVDDSEKLVA